VADAARDREPRPGAALLSGCRPKAQAQLLDPPLSVAFRATVPFSSAEYVPDTRPVLNATTSLGS